MSQSVTSAGQSKGGGASPLLWAHVWAEESSRHGLEEPLSACPQGVSSGHTSVVRPPARREAAQCALTHCPPASPRATQRQGLCLPQPSPPTAPAVLTQRILDARVPALCPPPAPGPVRQCLCSCPGRAGSSERLLPRGPSHLVRILARLGGFSPRPGERLAGPREGESGASCGGGRAHQSCHPHLPILGPDGTEARGLLS